MADNILVEVITKGTENATNGYQQIADSAKKASDSINTVTQAEKDLQKATDIIAQSTDGLTAKQLKLRESINSVGGIIQKNTGTVRENSAMNKQLQTQLTTLIAEFDKETTSQKKNTDALKENTTKQVSLRGEIKQSREELARMMATGDLTTAQIYSMAKGAGNLKDAFGDASGAIQVLSSDTFALDATIQTVQSLTAGFQVFQGVQALVGDENKDLQQVLVKLNAIMAITSGLQQIQNALQKNSAQLLGLSVVAQKAYTIAVGESTGAVRIFRLAMLSIGIGAIIAGIILLVQNWSKLKDAITGTTDAMREQERLSRLNSETRKEASDSIKSEVASIYELVAIAKNENLTRADRQRAIDELQKKYPDYLKNINLETIGTDATNKAIQSQIELLTQREQIKKLADKRAELSNKLIDESALEEQFTLYEKFKIKLFGGSQKSNLVGFEDLELNEAAASAQKRVKSEIQKQIDDVDVLFKQILDKIGQSNKSVLEGSKKTIEKAVKDTKVKISEPIEIPLPVKLSLLDLDKSIQDVFAQLQEQIRVAESELLAEFTINPNSESLEPLSARLRDLTKQLEILKARYEDIKNPKPINILDGFIEPPTPESLEKDFPPAEKTLFERIFGTPQENETRAQEIQRIVNGAIKIVSELNNIGNQIADIASQAIKQRADVELSQLDAKREKGLISEKKYQQESAKIKNEAAKKQRAVDIAMAVAKIPLVVLEALSSAPPPFNYALAAIAGAIAAAQVAILASAPLPKFRHGGFVGDIFYGSGFVKGKRHEQGGVNAELEGTEFVHKREAVSKYGVPFLESINNLSFKMPSFPTTLSQKKDIVYDFSNMEKLMNENNDYLYKLTKKNNNQTIIIKENGRVYS